jgi:hypothetical protein
MTDWTKALKGRQVSPVSMDDLCTYGMYGSVLDVFLNQVLVRWADGRMVTHYQSELELVPIPDKH